MLVFEKLIAYFLDKYISKYIENFDSNNLKIGLWSGEVVFENLYLKPNALDELNLPVRVAFGHLGKLKLILPWQSLYKGIKASMEIDGLTVLIMPMSSVSYDFEKEKADLKEKKLSDVENLLKKEKQFSKTNKKNEKKEESQKIDEQDDTYIEKIQLQILKNLEINIKNIHVRYEDDFTKPEHPFSVGFTLDEFDLKNAEEKWNADYSKENPTHIVKLAKLNSFAIYCTSDDVLINNEIKEIVILRLQNMIKYGYTMRYILNPMSLSTEIILNMKPNSENYKNPMFDFTILLESVGLNLNRLQYFDIFDLVNTIDFMILNAKYQKYRPKISIKLDPKSWWRFAYDALAETQIRPKKEQFKWEHIKLITKTRREYVKVLVSKRKHNGKLTPYEQEQEKKAEDILDVFNLVLARKLSNAEIHESSKKSWRSKIWSSPLKNQLEQDIKYSQQVILTNLSEKEKDEINKLFDNGSSNGFLNSLPSLNVKFKLKKFQVSISHGEYKTAEKEIFISDKNLVHLLVDNLDLGVNVVFPITNGLKITASVQNILLSGSSHDSYISAKDTNKNIIDTPILMQPETQDSVFGEMQFELNPPSSQAFNKRLMVKSEPFKIIYHSPTINNIVYFFRSYESVKQRRLKRSALKTISQVKGRSVTFMENNLKYIESVDLNVVLKPITLILPQDGILKEHSSYLCFNLGEFSCQTESKPTDNESDKESEISSETVTETESSEDEAQENENTNSKFTSAEEILINSRPSISREKNMLKNFHISKTTNERNLSIINNFENIAAALYMNFEVNLKQVKIILVYEETNEATSTSQPKEFFILKPLDVYLNINKCVYEDDANLPSLKLIGSLPIIDLNITEKKLEKITQVLLSVPLPLSKNPNSSDDSKVSLSSAVEEDIDEDEKLDDVEQEEAIDLLFQNLSFKGNPKSFTKLSNNLELTLLENIQQSIDFEVLFEIKEINFTIKEEEPKYFDWLLFKSSSFGALLQRKTFDTYLNVYLNQISCEYGMLKDVDGKPLYLFSSANDKSEKTYKKSQLKRSKSYNFRDTSANLIDIKLIQTDSASPTLKVLHDNVLVNINIELCVINLVCNVMAGRNILCFVDSFLKGINFAEYRYSKNPAKKVEKETSEPILSVEQIKKIISKHKSKRSLATQKSLIKSSIDSNVVGIKVNAKLEGVRARICTSNENYFDVHVQDFEAFAVSKDTELSLNLLLHSINVFDLDPSAKYKKMITLKDGMDNLLTVQLTLFNSSKSASSESTSLITKYQNDKLYFKNYFNSDYFNLEVKANISKLRFIFFFRHFLLCLRIWKLMDFDTFIYSQIDSANLAKERLKEKVKKFDFSYVFRIKFDVTLHAPIIILPLTPTSKDAVLFDCGTATVKSSQEVLYDYYEKDARKLSEKKLNDVVGLPPIIETHRVLLANMEAIRVMLDDDSNVISALSLVNCSELRLDIRRNCQPKIFEDIEMVNFDAFYEEILATISTSDYTFILEAFFTIIADYNISDPDFKGLIDNINLNSIEKRSSIKNIKMLNDANSPKINNETPYLVIVININSVKMHLFNKDNKMTKRKVVRHTRDLFSRTELKQLYFKLNMFDDYLNERSIYNLVFQIETVWSDDARDIKNIKKAPRVIDRYNLEKTKDFPMVYLTMVSSIIRPTESQQFVPDKREIKFKNSLLCINMDYLILIYDFFVGGWPTAKQPPPKIQPETKPPVAGFENSDAIYWNFEFDNPRFIIYEDQFDYKKSNVLILFTKLISFKLTSSDEKMDFYSSFFDFMIKLRSNKANKYGKPLKYTVLSPTTFNFFGVIFDSKRPENKDKIHEHYNVVLHDIHLNMTPLMLNISLKMWTSIMNSFDKRFNPVVVEKRVVSRVQDEGLFKPVPFKADDFWFTQKKSIEEASIRSSASSKDQLESPQQELGPKPEPPIHTKSELTIEASKIFVKLEVEQMPLIKLNMSINNGKYGDWYGSPSLSLKIDLDFTYFNEEENVWEPVIEPMESNGVLKPYQLVFDMKTNSDSILKMRERDDNLPIRTFFIFSKMPLEFVVTRKFISLLETIQRNYVIDDDKNRAIEEDDDYNLTNPNFKVEEASGEEEEDLRIEEEDEVELDESYSSFNFLVKNELGQDVFLESICGFNFKNLDAHLQLNKKKRSIENVKTISLKNGQHIPISLTNLIETNLNEHHEELRHQMKVKIELPNSGFIPKVVDFGKSSITGAYLFQETTSPRYDEKALIICQTVFNLDKRRIFLHSSVQITNKMNFNVEVHYPTNPDSLLASSSSWGNNVIKSGKMWYLPLEIITLTQTDLLKITPIVENSTEVYEKQIINWNSNKSNELLSFNDKIFIEVFIEKKKIVIYDEMNKKKTDYIFNLILMPTVTFFNYLPYKITYYISNDMRQRVANEEEDSFEKKNLDPGESVQLLNSKIGSCYLNLEIENYNNTKWLSSQFVDNKDVHDKKKYKIPSIPMPYKKEKLKKVKSSVIKFTSATSQSQKMNLVLNSLSENGCLSLAIFTPYWILNHTKLKLMYKYENYDKHEYELNDLVNESPLFLDIDSDTFHDQKKNLLIKVNSNDYSTHWSNPFLVDAVANNGTIVSETKQASCCENLACCKKLLKEKTTSLDKYYKIGFDVQLNSIGLTRIIKLTPSYLLINNTNLILDVMEFLNNEEPSMVHLKLMPNTINPFWTIEDTKRNCLLVRPIKTEEEINSKLKFSSPFWYNLNHKTLLRLKDNPYLDVLSVECITTNNINRIIFKQYSYGMAPVLILNYLSDVPIVVHQNQEPNDEVKINPGQYNLKLLANPIGKRELSWSCGITENQIYSIETMETKILEFNITEQRKGYAITFLDNLQKVWMFFENKRTIKDEVFGFNKLEGDEYVISLEQNFGLSLVDDKRQVEILYMSITSSKIIWCNRSEKLFFNSDFSMERLEDLERVYQEYLLARPKIRQSKKTKTPEKKYHVDEDCQVDFDNMIMYENGRQIPITRYFEPGLYLNFFNSNTRTSIKLRVFKIQIDNQLDDSEFPVTFCQAPEPLSLHNSKGIKPMIEMSMQNIHNNIAQSNELRDLKLKIQEFIIKVDIVLITALVNFFNEAPNVNKKYFYASNEFYKEMSDELGRIKKSSTDLFHLGETLNNQKTDTMFINNFEISKIKMHLSFSLSDADAIPETILNNGFLESLGVVLTNCQDVVIKLNKMKVTNTIKSWNDLKEEAIFDFKNKLIKQSYNLILGLDVIGNPFGIIRGLKQGVKSAVVEPIAGLQHGPVEFFEGLTVGVANLIGKTLGGAAGGLSKVTGTVSEGLSSLTFDKEFQRKRRRIPFNSEPTFVNLIRKNLVMPVYDGITGVVREPIEGAKTKSTANFLKGVGKGVVGVAAKPATGVFDLASEGFEKIRRTVVQEEYNRRVRPPRCFYPDNIIRPYNFEEAKVTSILKNLDTSRFIHDYYFTSLEDKESLLVVTHRHILLISGNLLFGSNQVKWWYNIRDAITEPELTTDGIKMTFRNENKTCLKKQDIIEEKVILDLPKDKIENFASTVKRKIVQVRNLSIIPNSDVNEDEETEV